MGLSEGSSGEVLGDESSGIIEGVIGESELSVTIDNCCESVRGVTAFRLVFEADGRSVSDMGIASGATAAGDDVCKTLRCFFLRIVRSLCWRVDGDVSSPVIVMSSSSLVFISGTSMKRSLRDDLWRRGVMTGSERSTPTDEVSSSLRGGGCSESRSASSSPAIGLENTWEEQKVVNYLGTPFVLSKPLTE